MKIDFNTAIANSPSSNRGSDFKVKFFGLKENETAIVRFLIDSTDDFDIYVDHPNIEFDNKNYQRVNCIRAASEPIHKCPLCEANYSIEQVAFFKMLRYDADENGNIIITPVVWSRSIKSAIVTDLVNYLNTYGSLSDMICSITRTGKGFNDTKYSIAPNLPAARYPDSVYVNDPSGFADYTILGTLIKDWNAEQMTEFLQTGSNPVHRDGEPQYRPVNSVATNINDSDLPFNEPTMPINTVPAQPQTTSQPAYTGNTVPDNTAPIKPTTAAPITPNSIPTRTIPQAFTPINRPQRSYN